MASTKLFYKYMPFDPNGSLRVITDGTIKFSNPEEFNDPFDCNPIVNGQSYEDKIRTDPVLRKNLCKKMGISPGQWVAQKKKLLTRIRKGFEAGQYNELTQQRLGVCCLTIDAVNPLMWAHYSDSHQGFVVEFQVPTTYDPAEYTADPFFDVKILASQQVHYVREKPTISAFDPVDDRVNKGFYYKSEHWKYEKEYRVLSRDLGPGIHHYARNRILSSVIAGCRMSSDDRNQLRLAVDMLNQKEHTNVQLYDTALSNELFAVEIPGHPVWGQTEN